jgi:hypothetical protein
MSADVQRMNNSNVVVHGYLINVVTNLMLEPITRSGDIPVFLLYFGQLIVLVSLIDLIRLGSFS